MRFFRGFLIVLSIVFIWLILIALSDVLRGPVGFLGGIGHAIGIIILVVSLIMLNFNLSMMAFDSILKLNRRFKLAIYSVYVVPFVIYIIAILLGILMLFFLFYFIVIGAFIFAALILPIVIIVVHKNNHKAKRLFMIFFIPFIGSIMYFASNKKQIELKDSNKLQQNLIDKYNKERDSFF